MEPSSRSQKISANTPIISLGEFLVTMVLYAREHVKNMALRAKMISHHLPKPSMKVRTPFRAHSCCKTIFSFLIEKNNRDILVSCIINAVVIVLFY